MGENLRRTVELQTKSLLGSDLAITARKPFDEEAMKYFRGVGGEEICAGAGYAKSHSGPVKSVIYAVLRLRYIEVVHTDSPAPPGFPTKTTRCAP